MYDMSIYSNSMGNIYSCHCFRIKHRMLSPSVWYPGRSYTPHVCTLQLLKLQSDYPYPACSGYERFTYQSIRQTWEEAGPHTIQGLQPNNHKTSVMGESSAAIKPCSLIAVLKCSCSDFLAGLAMCLCDCGCKMICLTGCLPLWAIERQFM